MIRLNIRIRKKECTFIVEVKWGSVGYQIVSRFHSRARKLPFDKKIIISDVLDKRGIENRK